VGLSLDFSPRIFHRDREARDAHGRQVDDIVADKCALIGFQARFFHDLLKSGALVLTSLLHELESEVPGAERDGFGEAFRNQSCAQSAETRERDRDTVVGVKAFELDGALSAEFGSTLVLLTSVPWLLAIREKEKLAVGEDAVNVEEQELDFAGAGVRGELGHGKKVYHYRVGIYDS